MLQANELSLIYGQLVVTELLPDEGPYGNCSFCHQLDGPVKSVAQSAGSSGKFSVGPDSIEWHLECNERHERWSYNLGDRVKSRFTHVPLLS